MVLSSNLLYHVLKCLCRAFLNVFKSFTSVKLFLEKYHMKNMKLILLIYLFIDLGKVNHLNGNLILMFILLFIY